MLFAFLKNILVIHKFLIKMCNSGNFNNIFEK